MAVQYLHQPDISAMLAQLEHVFGGDLDGHHNGLIELAWTDANGRLSQATYFDSDDFDGLIERAVEVNREGANVYIGAALRDSECPPMGRSEDSDALALTCLYADLDDVGAPEKAKRIYDELKVPPTGVCVTGRTPDRRAQLWWRLDEPIKAAIGWSGDLRAIAVRLGGDTTVTNHGRVLRLAGSIAWPKKPGRVVEMTEWHALAKRPSNPSFYGAAALRAKMAPPDGEQQAASTSDAPRSAISGKLKLFETLELTRSQGHWHHNMVAAIASMVSSNWTNEQIRLACSGYCDNGFHDPDLDPIIGSAREKWDKPDPEAVEPAEPEAPPLRLKDWRVERFAPGQAPPIKWLAKGVIPLGEPILLAGMGGIGKSFLELDMALNIALGVTGAISGKPKSAMGGEICARGTVVMLTAEDNANSVHRRLDKIDPQGKRMHAEGRLIVVPMPSAGGPRTLIAPDKNGAIKTEFFGEFRSQLREIDDLVLVIVDPLSAFVGIDVNADSAATQFMWSSLAEICAEHGATVLVAHHVRKDGMHRISSSDDAREAIRGVTTLVDGARLAYALWKIPEDDEVMICEGLGRTHERGCVVKGAVVKANDEAVWDEHIYVRDETGLLIERTQEAAQIVREESEVSRDNARKVLQDIDDRWKAGQPWSMQPQAGGRYILPWMQRKTGAPKGACTSLLRAWMYDGFLMEDDVSSHSKMRGLRLLSWPF